MSKRAKKPEAATHLERFRAVLDLAEVTRQTARVAYERAQRTHDDAREAFAREVYRDVRAGSQSYAGWLRNYVLAGGLWDEVGRAAFYAIARPGEGDDNPAAWGAVFKAVAKHKGW